MNTELSRGGTFFATATRADRSAHRRRSGPILPKFCSAVLACLALYGASFSVTAEERYRAIALNPGYEFGTEKALILDTQTGHLWLWTESPASDRRPGGRYVIYQGQLDPGREMGDIIAKQEWPAGSKGRGK